MAMPKVLEEPKKPLGALTAVVAAFTAVFAYGQARDQVGVIIVMMVPVVVLSLVARTRAGFRGWLYLIVAWVVGVLGVGVLLGV